MKRSLKWLVVIAVVLMNVVGSAQFTVMPEPKMQFFDANGNPLASGTLTAYEAGTGILQDMYADSLGVTVLANPLILDSAGRAVIYLKAASYRFLLKSAAGATIWDVDNVSAIPAISTVVDILGTPGETVLARQVVYLSDGSGGKTAGQWFVASSSNAYSSTQPIIGIALANSSLGSALSIRMGGRLTGLSGLLAGTTYYVNSTGALTSTAVIGLTNIRRMGVADTTTSLVIDANPPRLDSVLNQQNGFRLTLTTGLAVTTSDVTAATTLYWTPYKTPYISLHDGVSWRLYTTGELSIAVPAVANQIYSVFVAAVAGVPTLSLIAWTNDTTPGGLGANTRALNGVRMSCTTCSPGDTPTDKRFLGLIRTTGVAGQTEDSAANRFVWNMDNPVRRTLKKSDTTATWNYTTATWRQANAAAANQVNLIQGFSQIAQNLSERPIWLQAKSFATNSAGTAVINTAIGEDSTTTPVDAASVGMGYILTAASGATATALLEKVPSIGYHAYVWLEASTATGTTTFYGAANTTAASLNANGNGLQGFIEN